MGTLHAFGDSITLGTGASAPAAGYLQLWAAAQGYSITNHAVSGAQCGDQAGAVYGISPGQSSVSSYMIGVNDQTHHGLNPVNLACFKADLMAQAAWLALDNSAIKRGASFVYGGSGWNTATAFGSMGKYTDTQGDYYEVTLSGEVLYLATIQQTGSDGQEQISIDGEDYGTFPVAPSSPITTTIGITYMPKLYRFGGLDSGRHTIRVVKTNQTMAGSRIYSGWAWGSAALSKLRAPKLYLFTPTPETAAGYASAGGSLLATQAYRNAVISVQRQLAADGLNVVLVDAFSAINTAMDIGSDGIHPNDSGHLNIAAFGAAA